jgi:hypothetical protein
MQKYGFIYLWFDKKNRKYYLGRHWGSVGDGYVCSSNNMRMNYKNRPQDFKRRILSLVYTSKADLVLEEQYWLDMIKKEELGVRYYNVTKSASTPSTLGYKHSEETKNKIRESNTGLKRSEETKQRNREANTKQFEDESQREMRRVKSKELWDDPEYREKQKAKGKNYTEDTLKVRAQKTGKRVVINGVEYFSAGDASRTLNKSVTWCRYWDESGNTKYSKLTRKI